MALVSGGIPALFVLAVWLPPRLRLARRAGHARRLRDRDIGFDVFALRALARQPIAELARLRTDPAAGWRNLDPVVIEALALSNCVVSASVPPARLVTFRRAAAANFHVTDYIAETRLAA